MSRELRRDTLACKSASCNKMKGGRKSKPNTASGVARVCVQQANSGGAWLLVLWGSH